MYFVAVYLLLEYSLTLSRFTDVEHSFDFPALFSHCCHTKLHSHPLATIQNILLSVLKKDQRYFGVKIWGKYLYTERITNHGRFFATLDIVKSLLLSLSEFRPLGIFQIFDHETLLLLHKLFHWCRYIEQLWTFKLSI